MLINKSLMDHVDEDSKKLYTKIMDIIWEIDDLKKNDQFKLPRFECHSICRAFSEIIPGLDFVDGGYVGVSKHEEANDNISVMTELCYHTWLKTPSGIIIDIWPVGIISPNPLLIVNKGRYAPYSSGLYIEASEAVSCKIKRSVKWRATRIANILKKMLPSQNTTN